MLYHTGPWVSTLLVVTCRFPVLVDLLPQSFGEPDSTPHGLRILVACSWKALALQVVVLRVCSEIKRNVCVSLCFFGRLLLTGLYNVQVLWDDDLVRTFDVTFPQNVDSDHVRYVLLSWFSMFIAVPYKERPFHTWGPMRNSAAFEEFSDLRPVVVF